MRLPYPAPRLGVGVSRDRLRAVLLRGRRVVWHAETAIAGEESLTDALVRLVSGTKLRGLARPRMCVALGPAHAQLKALTGLPAVTDSRVLTQLVSESAARFFLLPSRGLLVPAVRVTREGATWAAALDASIVAELAVAAEQLGVTLERVLPAPAALAHATRVAEARWCDDGQPVRARFAHGALTAVARDSDGEGPSAAEPVPALARLGEGAWGFADAFGAAASGKRTPHAWSAASDAGRLNARRRARTGVLAVLAACAAVAALVAPGARATLELRSARAQLAAVGARRAEAARLDYELRQVSALLDGAERFRADRRSFTVLLGALSRALPESTAMMTLRADTVEGTFVSLSPRAADLVPALVGTPAVRDPRIVGSVTREVVAGAKLERATVRFRRTDAALPSSPRGAR